MAAHGALAPSALRASDTLGVPGDTGKPWHAMCAPPPARGSMAG